MYCIPSVMYCKIHHRWLCFHNGLLIHRPGWGMYHPIQGHLCQWHHSWLFELTRRHSWCHCHSWPCIGRYIAPEGRCICLINLFQPVKVGALQGLIDLGFNDNEGLLALHNLEWLAGEAEWPRDGVWSCTTQVLNAQMHIRLTQETSN